MYTLVYLNGNLNNHPDTLTLLPAS